MKKIHVKQHHTDPNPTTQSGKIVKWGSPEKVDTVSLIVGLSVRRSRSG